MIVLRIGDKLGAQDLIRLGVTAVQQSEPDLLVAEITRLAEEVGWKSAYEIDSGLERAISYKRNQMLAQGI